jgi:hypothetical protein
MAVARAVGGTIKWALMVAALVILVLIVAVVVGFGHAVDRSDKNAKQVSPAKYARVHIGMSTSKVRRLLGRPENTYTSEAKSLQVNCWQYGVLARSATYSFCFANGELAMKSRAGR